MVRRAASQRRPSPPPDAFLGIDLGTTSSRARLVVPETQQTYDIVHYPSSTRNGRFTEGEFSSTIYPIDGNGPLYNGNVTAPGRVALSAKISFPSLVGEEFGMELHQEGYALVLGHLELLKDDRARQRAEQGIKELFKTISKRLEKQFSGKNLRVAIKAIGLSIPAHWTLEYEDLYRSIVIETFDSFQGEILFLTEAEALAHYLFRDHHELLISAKGDQDQDIEDGEGSEEDEYEDRGQGREVVLIMDFGGHNMNGCIINIASGSKQEHPGFYHLTKAQDAGGGSEQWEHYVAEECIGMMIKEGYIRSRQDVKPGQRQLLLDDFNTFKKAMCEDSNEDFEVRRLVFDGRKATLPLVLNHERIIAAHKKAFNNAFQKADSMIKEAAMLSNKTARVIVTGGSVRSSLTEKKLEKLCENHGIDKDNLVFVAKQGVLGLNMRIAHGAAYAIAYQLSVREFIDRGAAFGMQVKTVGPRSHPDDEDWNNYASLLFSQGRPYAPLPQFVSTGRSEFKIICDPFFKDSNNDFLQHDRCYDFLHLGVLRRGRWAFYMKIIDTDKGTSLKLKGHGIDYVSPNRIILKKTWIFDMYTNVGVNAVHLGSPNKTPDDIFGEFWKDLQPTKPTTSAGSAIRGKTKKRYRRMPATNRVTKNKGPSASSSSSLPLPKSSLLCYEPQKDSEPSNGGVVERTPPLWQSGDLEKYITEHRSAGSASGFTREHFTTPDQRQHLQLLGKQSLDQMMVISNPEMH
ncbi:hypothetical protein F5Y08DRAFT_316577 [Xylaria arbuscula]|nr:hypothetical protein F5Y08DRAFT_316577 [Xylaria arbuscula]